ncbi:hypothetical protein R3P38DRAFT_2527007 [Favolaschia claudopus]|uniref:Uncharacterized protein n=1 Tax=Favolaschia claudopus TaxID=2862362 RepID=A0AAW0BM01_9AGAR
MWAPDQISSAPRPHSILVPAPAAHPPLGYTYPQGDSYTLTPSMDQRFTRGCAYVTLFTPSKKGILRSRLLQTKTPPNVIPRLDDGKIVVDPISGMIQMPGSVPFVQHIEGRPDEVVTMACAHTLDSIRAAYPDIADDLEDLSLRLRDATFGCEAKPGHPAMKPIYTLQGLKRNDRSVDARDLPPGYFDGSYNLATTKGCGFYMPSNATSFPALFPSLSTQ